jgi:hypothetical protein
VRTVVDGMKQDEDLFVVAEALFGDSQLASARLARLTVEELAAREPRKPAIRALFADARARGSSPDGLLHELASAPWLPIRRTREIFLFLSQRSAQMGRTWAQAREVRGIASRGPRSVGFIDVARAPDNPLGITTLRSGRVLDLRRGLVLGAEPPQGLIASTLEVRGRGPDRVTVRRTAGHSDGKLHVLRFFGQGALAVVDDTMLRAGYVQLALLKAPDPRAYRSEGAFPHGQLFGVVP